MDMALGHLVHKNHILLADVIPEKDTNTAKDSLEYSQ
jgi:hypothetical protein